MATGDIVVDFSGLSDENPYEDIRFEELTSGQGKILDGQLMSAGNGAAFIKWVDSEPQGDVIRAKMLTTYDWQISGTEVGLILYDQNQNGFLWFHNGPNNFLSVRTNGSNVRNITVPNNNYPSNSEFELEFDKSTGRIELFINGVSIINETDSTHADKNIGAGIFLQNNSSPSYGISVFAADGYMLHTQTPGLPATTILDKDGNPLASTQVAITVTAGATTLYDDTPTTDGNGLLPELDFSAHGSEPEVDDEVTWTITAGGITQSVTRTLVDLGD